MDARPIQLADAPDAVAEAELIVLEANMSHKAGMALCKCGHAPNSHRIAEVSNNMRGGCLACEAAHPGERRCSGYQWSPPLATWVPPSKLLQPTITNVPAEPVDNVISSARCACGHLLVEHDCSEDNDVAPCCVANCLCDAFYDERSFTGGDSPEPLGH